MKVKRKKCLVPSTSLLSFGYNERSELSSASLGATPYAYDYDNIGNRKTALEITEEISYDAKWGQPRSDDKERSATIAHEYDHRDTYVVGFGNEVNSLNTNYDQKKYTTKDAAENVGKEAKTKVEDIYKKAIQHSKSFDTSPHDQGGMYASHPFQYNP